MLASKKEKEEDAENEGGNAECYSNRFVIQMLYEVHAAIRSHKNFSKKKFF